MRTGDDAVAVTAFRRALELYSGELLSAEGPAEWILAERENLRSAAVQASFALAEIHARQGELVAAAFACERGLRLDPYRDGLWRMLIDVYDRGGESAAAARAREQYGAVLEELGVEDSSFARLD
jgi:DNA-binding SARP family transcriptional activator